MVLKDIKCVICDNVFTPKRKDSSYCSKNCGKRLEWERYKTKRNASDNPMQSRGGNRWSGEEHNFYKDGKWTKTGEGKFIKLRKMMKETINKCERCSKELKDVPSSGWACHHKDHNHSNNDISNLELLCKRCHQIEHNCVNNLNK